MRHGPREDYGAESQRCSLSKKLCSEVPDGCRDDAKALPQSILHNHPIAGEPCIAELYRRHNLYMHIHFVWGIRHLGKIKSENFCAVFHRLPPGFRNDFPDCLSVEEGQGKHCRRKLLISNDKQAVFIEDVQLREYPNVSLFRNVISAVRLTLLDLCLRGGADERLDKFFYPLIELGFLEIDRKEGLVCGSPSGSIFQGEPIDQVVEGGAKVVDAITDHQRKRWVNWCALCKIDDQLLPLSVELVRNLDARISFRAKQKFESRVDVTEVMFCPVDLCADAR